MPGNRLHNERRGDDTGGRQPTTLAGKYNIAAQGPKTTPTRRLGDGTMTGGARAEPCAFALKQMFGYSRRP
jgi:hypothetical protein